MQTETGRLDSEGQCIATVSSRAGQGHDVVNGDVDVIVRQYVRDLQAVYVKRPSMLLLPPLPLLLLLLLLFTLYSYKYIIIDINDDLSKMSKSKLIELY
jgi:hypothetical protein